jgi:hypothetical protein
LGVAEHLAKLVRHIEIGRRQFTGVATLPGSIVPAEFLAPTSRQTHHGRVRAGVDRHHVRTGVHGHQDVRRRVDGRRDPGVRRGRGNGVQGWPSVGERAQNLHDRVGIRRGVHGIDQGRAGRAPPATHDSRQNRHHHELEKSHQNLPRLSDTSSVTEKGKGCKVIIITIVTSMELRIGLREKNLRD